jgi:ectoine hydroxylase-related dioxygenase (phytanoyl-CoA dioxygenase family)
MRNEVTQEQVGFYRENGYLVIEEFLDRDELTQLPQLVEHASVL